MVGSDIGDINSPTHAGSRTTRVDPKLFGKPSDFCGDRREWRHFECVFRNWFGFLYDTAEEWLDQAANAPGELGEAVPYRRETDKALYMSLAMVCKNEALDVVKTVTHKRGFESWRKLSKEYGATTGTSLHEYTNLLEYDFGTTDGFKKRLLKWENQIVDFQKATGEVFSDRLKCAIVLSRSPAPIRTYLRVQNRVKNRRDYGALRVALMNYLEAEDDGHGPVPMEVGAMKGKKGDRGKKGYGKGKFGKSLGKYDKSNEHSKINDYGKGSEKKKKEGRKAKEKDKEKMRNQRQTRVSKATAGHVANGDTRRVSVGKDTCKLWRKFRVLLQVQWHQVQQPHRRLRRQQRLFKNSMMSRNQDGSSA